MEQPPGRPGAAFFELKGAMTLPTNNTPVFDLAVVMT